MIVYSNKIIDFVQRIHVLIKRILSSEIGVQVRGLRFLYGRRQASYPIKVVVYAHKSMIGSFDPNFYELGFHEDLMGSSTEVLEDVIRHELAHYFLFIQHGNTIRPHGVEFKAFCEKMGWSERVARASMCTVSEEAGTASEESFLLRKIQKLMALSKSSNACEARLAMIKSQQMLLKHNLDVSLLNEEGERVFLQRVLHRKRIDAEMKAIGKILETFFVVVVYHKMADGTCLEILGSKENVEVADYVAGVLQNELSRLWLQAQKEGGLSGTLAKNSFFWGIAHGYCSQVEELYQKDNREVCSALLVMSQSLEEAKNMVYPHMKERLSYSRRCLEASDLGRQMGKEMKIRPAVAACLQRKLLG